MAGKRCTDHSFANQKAVVTHKVRLRAGANASFNGSFGSLPKVLSIATRNTHLKGEDLSSTMRRGKAALSSTKFKIIAGARQKQGEQAKTLLGLANIV